MIKIKTLDKIVADKDTGYELIEQIVDKISDSILINYANVKNKKCAKTKVFNEIVNKIFGCDFGGEAKKDAIELFLKMSYDDVQEKFKEYISNSKVIKNTQKKILSEIFNYESIMKRQLDRITFRHHLMVQMKIDVCPYCNRLYITRFIPGDDSKKKKSTADLDHYYLKSIYPIFALSLFNFIPSCGVCNSTFKDNKFTNENGIPPLYPGKAGFGNNAHFVVKPNHDAEDKDKKLLDIWFGKEKTDFDINLEIDKSPYEDEIKRSIELFGLDKVYNSHTGYASEIMLKHRIFHSDDYKNMLSSTLKGIKCDSSEISDREIESFLFGFNWSEEDNADVNRPLSKLTYDLIN